LEIVDRGWKKCERSGLVFVDGGFDFLEGVEGEEALLLV
jgi:hypothetical protein